MSKRSVVGFRQMLPSMSVASNEGRASGGVQIVLILFVLGMVGLLAGATLGYLWRGRVWDSRSFSVDRVASELRVSYGLAVVDQSLLGFGVFALMGDAVILIVSGGAPTARTALIVVAFVAVATLFSVRSSYTRRTEGKDALIIDMAHKQLRVPARARPDLSSVVLDLEEVEGIGTQRVKILRGTRIPSQDYRVVARVRGAPVPVIVAARLTEPWAKGLAEKLASLLGEARTQHRIPVDPVPMDVEESRY